MTGSALWVLLLLPVAAGGSLLALGPRADRYAAHVGTLTAVLLFGLALAVADASLTSAPPFLLGQPFALGLDGLSGALAVTVCLVTACVLAATAFQVEIRRARLCGYLLMFLASVLLTLFARSLLPLLVGWELMGAASYALIAHDLRDRHAASSATNALMTTRALDLGLYIAAGAALAGGGTLALEALPALPGGWRDLAALGVLVACLGKAAQLPVSWWLSRAMDGPSPVSALLHSAAMVAMGGYLLLRLSPLLDATSWASAVTAWIGALTVVLLGVVALAQTDLKQLLAASTASQLGFVVLAAGVGGIGAGSVHLVAHAAVKSLLFLAAGIWLHALGTRDLGQLKGAARQAPAVGLLAAAGLLALAGLPPLALWTSKDAVLVAALEHSPALYAIGLLGSGIAAGYAGRALWLLLSPTDGPVAGRVAVPAGAWLPLVPLGIGAVVLAALVLGPSGEAFADLLGVEQPLPTNLELAVSAVLSVAVLALTRRYGERAADLLPRAARQWWHLEQATHAVAVRPVLALSRALARFDDQVVDGAVEAAAAGSLRLAARSRRVDDRGIDRAVGGVAAGARRLGAAARRPQTGQLHQYYGQAATVLVAAVVLLVVVR